MPEPIAFLNGEYIPTSQAALPIYDKGVVMGATVTQMTRTYGQQLFRLEDHLDRLFLSLNYTSIDAGMTPDEMASISNELIEKNSALLGPDEELGLIHFVTAGKIPLYAGRPLSKEELRPTVCIHTFPLDFSYYAEPMRKGYHLVTPSIRHIPPQCIDAKVKYRSRLHWHLADELTHQVDPKATSLLLDLEGNITECSGANILLVSGDTIFSPTMKNILPGISRQVTIELAMELDIEFVEEDLQVFDVMSADEAFLTSTPFGICPATRINSRPIGNGSPGPIFKRLADAWSDMVELDIVGQVVQGKRQS